MPIHIFQGDKSLNEYLLTYGHMFWKITFIFVIYVCSGEMVALGLEPGVTFAFCLAARNHALYSVLRQVFLYDRFLDVIKFSSFRCACYPGTLAHSRQLQGIGYFVYCLQGENGQVSFLKYPHFRQRQSDDSRSVEKLISSYILADSNSRS